MRVVTGVFFFFTLHQFGEANLPFRVRNIYIHDDHFWGKKGTTAPQNVNAHLFIFKQNVCRGICALLQDTGGAYLPNEYRIKRFWKTFRLAPLHILIKNISELPKLNENERFWGKN